MARFEDEFACGANKEDLLEHEFIQSWNEVQQFYRSYDNSPLRKGIVLLFIAALRRAGYDRKLRTANSLYSLMLSRSRRYGLSAKQPFVAFEFRGVTMDLFFKHETGHGETVSGIPIWCAFFGSVKKALERLSNQPLSSSDAPKPT